MTQSPWFRDFLAITVPALLSREEFVAHYLPRYAKTYELPRGIRLRPDGRPTMAGAGAHKAQVTKRENIITEAYERYMRDHAGAVSLDTQPNG